MSQWTGRVTLTGTGLQTLVLGGFQPTWATFIVVDDDGESFGTTDGTRQNVAWKFNDGTTRDSDEVNTHCIKLPAGADPTTPKILAAFDSFTATGMKLNVTNFNSTKVKILCGN